jgi:hypothetical protein
VCQHVTYYDHSRAYNTLTPPPQTHSAKALSDDDVDSSNTDSDDDDSEGTDKAALDSQAVPPFHSFEFLFTPQGRGWGSGPSIDLGKIEPDDDSDDPDFTPDTDYDMDDEDSDMDDDDSDVVDGDMDDDEDVNLGLGVLDGGEINLERCLTPGFGIRLAAERGASEYPAQYKPTGPGRWSFPAGEKDHAYSLHFLGDGIPKHPFRYAGPWMFQAVQPHMDVSTILWLLCMGGKEGSGCGGQAGPESTLVGFFASDLFDTALLTEMASFLYPPGFHSVCATPFDERREYSFSCMDGPFVKRRARWDVINARLMIDREQKDGYM